MRSSFCHLAALMVAVWPVAAPAAPPVVPLPVEQGRELLEPSFRQTGLIETSFSWGSGVVAEHPRVVLSCAHVVYDDYYYRWTSGARWYRAYNSTGAPARATAQLLNGYFYWRSYATAVRSSQRAGYYTLSGALAREFHLDAVAYFNYADDLGGGEAARVLSDGAARLASGIPKWITGYPGGRYAPEDANEFRLHLTGPLAGKLRREYRAFPNYVTLENEAETGSGNSGGPVWVQDDDGQPAIAGILVAGLEAATDGYSVIGVHATSADSRELINAARDTAQQGDRVVTRSYAAKPGAVPDAVRLRGFTRRGALAKPLRVTGLPRTISEVKLDMSVEHPRRGDLVVMLQAPGNRRLPVYAGKFDTPGRDLSLQKEEAPLFYGLDPNGTWVLWIFDTRAGEGGNLVSATLHITAH